MDVLLTDGRVYIFYYKASVEGNKLNLTVMPSRVVQRKENDYQYLNTKKDIK